MTVPREQSGGQNSAYRSGCLHLIACYSNVLKRGAHISRDSAGPSVGLSTPLDTREDKKHPKEISGGTESRIGRRNRAMEFHWNYGRDVCAASALTSQQQFSTPRAEGYFGARQRGLTLVSPCNYNNYNSYNERPSCNRANYDSF